MRTDSDVTKSSVGLCFGVAAPWITLQAETGGCLLVTSVWFPRKLVLILEWKPAVKNSYGLTILVKWLLSNNSLQLNRELS